MRIGIEAQRIFRPNKHGMEIVVLEIIKQLQRIDNVNEYFIYVKKDEDVCLTSTSNFTIREIEGASFALWEQFSLPKAAKKDNCQLLHCTSNTAPLFIELPILITLHDIIFLEKSYFSILTGKGSIYQRFGNAYRKFIVPLILNKCKKIITVSYSEKEKIESFLKLKNNRLDVIYNAVNKRFKHTENNIEILKQFNISKPYILFHGNKHPKKNTENVLRAISILKSKHSMEIDVVITDIDSQYIHKVAKETKALNIFHQINAVGYIDTVKMPVLYSSSLVFLYPSLRESFGLPILEAMSCETPVITSDCYSMPEIAGGAAYLVNPENPDQMADAMAELISNSSIRNELIEKGKKNALRFSWENAAKETLKIYNKILAELYVPNT